MKWHLKHAEYYLFARWIATPSIFRDPPNQGAFQEKYNVSGQTLVNWKNDPNFWEDVKREIKEWTKEKTPDVIAAIYRSAIKGNPFSQKLWLQAFDEFQEKSENKQTHELGTSFFEAMKQRHDKHIQQPKQQPVVDGDIAT